MTLPARGMTIDGREIMPDATFAVVDPSTAEVFASAPECTPEQLDLAFAAAARALPGWAADEDTRRGALSAISSILVGHVDELACILTAEQGKPLANARAEVTGSAAWFDYYAALPLPREVVQADAAAHVEVRRRPVGVVAAITPWNFPLQLAAIKLAPALLAGNTVVLKPSPYTPLTTLRVAALVTDLLPPGVLNVVAGGDQVGRWMTAHPTPRKISLTGSIEAGKHVAAAAAHDLKRLTLELGGNDAALVLDDVDPGAVAKQLFWGAFRNNGQVCAAIKRLYVPRRLRDAIVDALAELARSVRVGAGTEEGVQLGPVNNKPQFDRIQGLVQDAHTAGAVIATGGAPLDSPGFFYAPTIVVHVSEGVRLVDEEQFGPALPILTYTDEDDAVARANATNYGLSGSVWSADPDRAEALATRLECGTAWVNTHLAVGPHQPLSGAKWSGLGIENGLPGLLAFTEPQVLHRPAGAA